MIVGSNFESSRIYRLRIRSLTATDKYPTSRSALFGSNSAMISDEKIKDDLQRLNAGLLPTVQAFLY